MDRLIAFSTQLTTRRRFAIGTALAGAALVLPRTGMIAARQAVDLASAGLPTLDITVRNDGYEGVPETTEAGRYLVNVTISDEVTAFGGFGGVAFMQAPAGMTSDDILASYKKGEGSAAPLTEIYQAKYAGGVAVAAGRSRQVVLDLTEGEWIAWADEPGAAQAPVMFTVTGTFPEDAPEPMSDISFTLLDFDVTVDGKLVAGDHILKITNRGAQPHHLLLDRYVGASDFDNDFMTAALEAEMSGAAMPDGFDPETDLESVAVSLSQSIGTNIWIQSSLEAGQYLAACFFPTAGTGVPHAMMGMHRVFEVTG